MKAADEIPAISMDRRTSAQPGWHTKWTNPAEASWFNGKGSLMPPWLAKTFDTKAALPQECLND